MSLDELDFNGLTENEKQGRLWHIFRRLAFNFDAESVHELTLLILKIKSLFSENYKPVQQPNLMKDLMGLRFLNPIGLAPGYDINAECLPALQALGFGFIEVGGVTEHAQEGSERPRIFCFPEDRALINRLNFSNKGVKNLRRKLSYLRDKNSIHIPIGANLGKSNLALGQEPEHDANCFRHLADVIDYVTINISCVSTQKPSDIRRTLDALCSINENLTLKIPVLLKLGPDLTNDEAVACAEIALDYCLAGLVISNTTAKHKNLGAGGLSGQPLFERSTHLLRCVAKDYGTRLTLVGSGGIMDGQSALAKLNAGADLLQVYSGLVYGGFGFVKLLLNYLPK
jgi:dihydroorotate dehydrogenase